MLRAIRKEHAKGILQEINVHCHVTRCFVHMKRRVQRCMLKAFLLGRNICWRCFARNKHILMRYYEGEWRAHCLYTDWAKTVQVVRAPLPRSFPSLSFPLSFWDEEKRGRERRKWTSWLINRCSLWKKRSFTCCFLSWHSLNMSPLSSEAPSICFFACETSLTRSFVPQHVLLNTSFLVYKTSHNMWHNVSSIYHFLL